MSKTFFHFLLMALCACALSACSKMTDNGKLDGMWHLQEIHTKPSNATSTEYTERSDVRDARIYWSFQLDLLQIRSAALLNGATSETMARFNYEGNKLNITATYIHFRDHDDFITDPATECLKDLGIRGNKAVFQINRLTDHQMILCSALDSLVFRKI